MLVTYTNNWCYIDTNIITKESKCIECEYKHLEKIDCIQKKLLECFRLEENLLIKLNKNEALHKNA